MRLPRAVAAAAALCLAAAGAWAGQDDPSRSYGVATRVLDLACPGCGRGKTITAAVWYPVETATAAIAGGPCPLLVFSHGFGGSGLGAAFFAESLAARGWIVAAPDHHDRRTASRRGLLREARAIAASGPEDRGRYLYRLDEMKAVLDGVLASAQLGGSVDKTRLAVGGHSFGGFTALGLCGAIPERRVPGIRAVLIFSSGAGAYLYRQDELASVRMPAMFFLGEKERSQRRGRLTMAELAGKLYGAAAPPKYLAEVRGADHFSFNNRLSDGWVARRLSGGEPQFSVIRRYGIAFLEKHVAGRSDEGVLSRQDAGLSRYRREEP